MNPNVNDMILFHDLFTGTYEIRIDPASAQQMIADYRESIERESAAEIATLKAELQDMREIAKGNAITADQWKRGAERLKAENARLMEAHKKIKIDLKNPLELRGTMEQALRSALWRAEQALASSPAEAEPAQDDGKPEGLTVEVVNAGLEVGFNGKDASESAWTIYRTNPFANRIGQTVFVELERRIEEAKE